MRQYHSIKQQVPHALLMFRLGDFYELFFEDAVVAARELEITLTSRNKDKEDSVPMCGVPHHSAEGYIAKLIQKGYRVAICEQMEDPSKTKTIVRRDITRIVTPGTVTESGVLTSRQNNFLAAVSRGPGDAAGGALLDFDRRISSDGNSGRRTRSSAGGLRCSGGAGSVRDAGFAAAAGIRGHGGDAVG